MSDIERHPHSLPVPISRAVRAGNFLFLAGQLAMNERGEFVGDDITAQTRAVLEAIAHELKFHGASMADVVRATVWLDDFSEFAEFNAEYAKHFPEGFPARSTVQSTLFKGAKVEIEVQAFVAS